MKVTDLELSGLKLIDTRQFKDNRGYFIERYNKSSFLQAGLDIDFVQDNHSFSNYGVIRGLHMQQNPNQGKLVGVMRGVILDVAVDARPKSPTFGKHVMVELSEENHQLLWIPAGFLHGFCVTSENGAHVLYKTDGLYNPAGEIGVRYNDPEIGINWPILEPILAERDLSLPQFEDVKHKLL